MNFKYIDYLANLAKLELSDIEKESISEHINQSINNVNILNEIDISNDFIDYRSKKASTLREDKVEKSLNTEKLLKNAPSRQANYFKLDTK